MGQGKGAPSLCCMELSASSSLLIEKTLVSALHRHSENHLCIDSTHPDSVLSHWFTLYPSASSIRSHSLGVEKHDSASSVLPWACLAFPGPLHFDIHSRMDLVIFCKKLVGIQRDWIENIDRFRGCCRLNSIVLWTHEPFRLLRSLGPLYNVHCPSFALLFSCLSLRDLLFRIPV